MVSLLKKYLDLETKIGHTFKNGKSLAEIVQAKPAQQELFKEVA